MADFESIEIDGQVSGQIPVEFKENKLTISGGKISAGAAYDIWEKGMRHWIQEDMKRGWSLADAAAWGI